MHKKGSLSPTYKERAIKLEEFNYINVYILSKEDIIASKIIYRVFCESYENFKKSFDDNNFRLEVAKQEDLEEQAKLVNYFLKLAYWY